MAAGTLYTYPENFRAYKIQAAANYSGFSLKLDNSFQYGTTNKSKDFQEKFPLGKVPAFESDNGVCLNESNAIAVFVANEQLIGGSQEKSAKVTQWVNFADQEILPAVCNWVFPCMGIMQYNKTNTEKAKGEIKQVLDVLNNHLKTRTFLVGERVTLADLSVSTTLLLAYQWVLEPEFRKPYNHVNRWFETVVNQPEVKKALPNFKMCEKMAQFDAKKYAEMSGAGDKKSKGGDKKKEGGDKKKKETPKKEEKKPKVEEQAEDEPPQEKKSKDPFLQFPASDKFTMDEWKKIYSNEDVKTVALPWFHNNFDSEKYSIWYGLYNYNDDLSKMDFMNVNLIGGMQQRLDGMRKHGFGVHGYFKEPKKVIQCIYIARGPELPFDLSPDLGIDAESYTWTKLNYSDDANKKRVDSYLLLEDEIDGHKLEEARVFK